MACDTLLNDVTEVTNESASVLLPLLTRILCTSTEHRAKRRQCI